jgi:hypothetical protein
VAHGADDGDRQADNLGADLVIPVLALLFSLYFFFDIAGLAWEAKSNGVIVGSILVLLVLIQIGRIARTRLRGEGKLGFGRLIEPREKLLPRIVLVVLLGAMVATIGITGTTLGLFLLMLSSMMLLGVRDWRPLLGVSLSVALGVYVAFILLLGTKLPAGPVERGLAALFGTGI